MDFERVLQFIVKDFSDGSIRYTLIGGFAMGVLGIVRAIDFLHAFRHISLSMLERARSLPIFEGRYKIPVLIPEDIIGLKVQALSNDTARQRLEMADIQRIMEQFGKDLDWELINDLFQLFNKEEFEALKKTYGET